MKASVVSTEPDGADHNKIWPDILTARSCPVAAAKLLAEHPTDPMVRLYAPLLGIDSSQVLVIGQLGQSLDGRIATITGDSHYINGSEGLDHLHRLRALTDAVMVGVGTVIADDPRLTVRRCEGVSPVPVIIDPRNRLPVEAKCLQNGERIIVIRAPDAPPAPEPAETLRLPTNHGGCFSPVDIIRELSGVGLHRVLIEGGALTLSKFIDNNVVHRLHLIVSAMLIGSGRPGLELKPIKALEGARRPKTGVHILGDGDVVFDCAFNAQDVNAKLACRSDTATRAETSLLA